MADTQRLGRAFSGFSAGVAGDLPRFQAGLRAEDEAQRKRTSELSEKRRKTAAVDFRNIRNLAAGGQTDRALTAINKRLTGISAFGGDPNTGMTASIKQLLESGQADQAVELLDFADQKAVEGGFIKARPQAKVLPASSVSATGQIATQDPTSGDVSLSAPLPGFQPGGGSTAGMASPRSRIFNNGTAFAVLRDGTTEVTNPAGQIVTGEERVKVLETARREEVEFRELTAGASARGGRTEARLQSTIGEGLDAAQGAAVLNRSIDLLGEIKTGGFRAAAIRAKQLFGVESADEGELASGLGKAVLSQLRATFGAAFTEREGARLEGIEARMGANTATNVRLLKQTLAIIERSANRAIDAAIESRDFRTAADIQSLLDFRLTDEGGTDQGSSFESDASGAPIITTQEQFDALPVGSQFIEDGITRIKE